jgi:hypothetical protein
MTVTTFSGAEYSGHARRLGDSPKRAGLVRATVVNPHGLNELSV